MDIVDVQTHLNKLGSLDLGIAAMEAVGVTSTLVDDFTGVYDKHFNSMPGYFLKNGAFRNLSPEAEAVANRDPARFGVIRRVDYRDPDLDASARMLADAPHVSVLRSVAWHASETEAFSRGEFDGVYKAAADYNLPVMALTQGRSDLMLRYVEKFPHVRIIIDHCGVRKQPGVLPEELDPVLELARFPNVYLKWTHAPLYFARTPYPFPDVSALLRRAVDAFGAERVMWGSDFTEAGQYASYGELLAYVRHSADLTDSAKALVLGGTARALFNWPAPKKKDVAVSPLYDLNK